MPSKAKGYGAGYLGARAALLADDPLCHVARCRRWATEADHQPPLSQHVHRAGSGCCVLMPMCSVHAREQGGKLGRGAQLARAQVRNARRTVELVEPAGLGVGDPCWRVPWLVDVLDVPAEATWPRYMTAPHPRAVGSFGAAAEAWAATVNRTGWRWWQRLAARRILEHDADGALVWRTWLLTVARQSGKSRLLRDLCDWRLHRGIDELGVLDDDLVLSVSRDIAILREMMRPALMRWKRDEVVGGAHKVGLVKGAEEVEATDLGTRWLGRSERAAFGLSVGFATIDECWDVAPATVDEMVVPTQAEMPQPQLGLASTAHRNATPLFPGRRAGCFEQLADPIDGDLLLEWSPPPDLDRADPAAWRAASPHWGRQREQLVAKALQRALAGEVADSTEADPIVGFDTQWLNRWPTRHAQRGKGVPLLDLEAWADAEGTAEQDGAYVIAAEDNLGHGAAVAVAIRTADGRVELGGWRCADWAEAMVWVERLAAWRPGSRLLVGATLLEQVPRGIGLARVERAGLTETRTGLPLVRSMLDARRLLHDATPDLDDQLAQARVVPAPSGGLTLVPGPRSDLVRAAVWALQGIEKRPPAPAIA
jgi:hypothetical protein